MNKKRLSLILFLVFSTTMGSIITLTRGNTDEHTMYAVGGELIPLTFDTILGSMATLLTTSIIVLLGCALAATIIMYRVNTLNPR